MRLKLLWRRMEISTRRNIAAANAVTKVRALYPRGIFTRDARARARARAVCFKGNKYGLNNVLLDATTSRALSRIGAAYRGHNAVKVHISYPGCIESARSHSYTQRLAAIHTLLLYIVNVNAANKELISEPLINTDARSV
jgi:hypothetical protein